MRHFAIDQKVCEQEGGIKKDIPFFIENELNLVNSCSFISNEYFEDFQAQAACSGAYLLWLIKVKFNYSESTSYFTFINPGLTDSSIFYSSELSKVKNGWEA